MSALAKQIPASIDSDIDLVHAIADKCMGLNHEQLLAVLFDLNLLKQGIEVGNLQLHKLTEELKKERKKFHYWFGRSSELSSRLKQIELENRIVKYQLVKYPNLLRRGWGFQSQLNSGTVLFVLGVSRFIRRCLY